MSEAAEVLTTPAVVVPPAEQPPGDAKPKSFDERWKAVGGEDLGDTEEPAAPAKSAPVASQAAPKAASDSGERAQLEQLAKKLGFSLDGNAVTVAERAEFRRARDKREREWEARERSIAEKEAAAGSNANVKRADAIVDALERGDPDGFAKAVGAKDFNEFQQNFIKRIADPNYAELRKLQQWKEDQEKLRVEAEQQARQNQHNQARAQAYQTYMATLSETCKASSDPLVAAMHDDPLFLQAVYNIQEQNWDRDLEKTCTVEEAISRAAKGTKSPLKDELRGLYDRLHKAFGAEVAAAATGAIEAQQRNGKKPAPKTAVTPKHTTADGGGPPKPIGEMSPAEWAEYKKKRFAESE